MALISSLLREERETEKPEIDLLGSEINTGITLSPLPFFPLRKLEEDPKRNAANCNTARSKLVDSEVSPLCSTFSQKSV